MVDFNSRSATIQPRIVNVKVIDDLMKERNGKTFLVNAIGFHEDESNDLTALNVLYFITFL